jgi:hypothetical protein
VQKRFAGEGILQYGELSVDAAAFTDNSPYCNISVTQSNNGRRNELRRPLFDCVTEILLGFTLAQLVIELVQAADARANLGQDIYNGGSILFFLNLFGDKPMQKNLAGDVILF